MNNILKQTKPINPPPQPKKETWSHHRQTIQSQKQEIEELASDLEFVNNCLRAALADLQRMDVKLETAQDEFYDLGDAVMDRMAGLESPFQYE